MRVNLLIAMIIFALIWPATALRAAVSKTTWADAPAREFVFVENNSDDNFFVTPGGALDPRLTGANRWTGLKYNGSGTIYQQSLGYIDNGYNTGLYTNWKFDMWLENSPVSSPLTGLRCINWYAGCNMTTSLILPQTTDASGFYGATVTSGGAKWMHGMLSDAFYQYLQQMPVGSSFTMTINACQTSRTMTPAAAHAVRISLRQLVCSQRHPYESSKSAVDKYPLAGGSIYQQRRKYRLWAKGMPTAGRKPSAAVQD